MSFVNTKYFSPVINDGITRAHPLSAEYRLWWKTEMDRCKNGYSVAGVKITGAHYFYLNWWKIRGLNKTTGRKEQIVARFTDLDYEYFHELELAKKAGKNFCVTKARQKGFSQKNASLVGREYTFFSHSQSIIIAGEEKYNKNTFKMCLSGLNGLSDTEFYKVRNPDTPEYIQAKYKVKNVSEEDGSSWTWKGSMSEVYSITGRMGDQAASGLSPNLVIMEEVGVWTDWIATYKFIQPMLETEGKKTGFCIVVGTGGEMDKGAKDLCEVFFNPAAYDMYEYENIWEFDKGDEVDGNMVDAGLVDKRDLKKVCYFVPAWKYKIIDEEGNSLQADSTEVLMDKRERERKSNKPNAFYIAVTQDPLIPNEAFLITGGNIFNTDKLYKRLSEIRKSSALSNIGQRGTLDWVEERNFIKGVTWTPSADGPFLIFEHPKLDEQGKPYYNLYFGATDSYDKDVAATSDSKLSCGIFKGELDSNSSANLFVARYTERPPTAAEAHENSAKLMMYYNAMNLIEHTNLLIFNWYKEHGLEYLLKERPQMVYDNVKNSKSQNRYGVDASTKDMWLQCYRDYIETNVDKMLDTEQIEAAIKYRKDPDYNCDITIHSSLCIVHWKDNAKIQVKSSKPKIDEFFHYGSRNGRMEMSFNRENKN
jgi:hypothetical protein